MAASRGGVIMISDVCAAPQSVLLFDCYFSMTFHEQQSFAWLFALFWQWWCLALGFNIYLHLNTFRSWITVSLLPRLSFGRNICWISLLWLAEMVQDSLGDLVMGYVSGKHHALLKLQLDQPTAVTHFLPTQNERKWLGNFYRVSRGLSLVASLVRSISFFSLAFEEVYLIYPLVYLAHHLCVDRPNVLQVIRRRPRLCLFVVPKFRTQSSPDLRLETSSSPSKRH